MKIDLSRHAEKFLKGLAIKQAKQIVYKMQELENSGTIHGSHKMHIAQGKYYRATAGEFRLIYKVDEVITITHIGKRNDDEIYLDFSRMSK